MKKLLAIAALAAVTFVAAGSPVMAQSYAYGGIVMADHSMRSSKLIGLPVFDDHGQKLGTIVDIMVKAEASEPTVILTTGTKMVAAPLSHISLDAKHVMMPGTTMAAIMAMPAYKFNGLEGGGG
jgi:sporulation protein YlmC with PRC-barrel domain